MLRLGFLLLVAVSVICIERNYFYHPNSTTWDEAREQCQACYKDLTTITPLNAEIIGLNLSSDYWIGLRQNMNGSKFWSQWANGEPVLYQNWYPGHPVPKKIPVPQPTCPPPPSPPPPVPNKPDVMQCPAFMRFCNCLNSSSDYEDILIYEPTEMFNGTNCTMKMSCPALGKVCDCLNSDEENETFFTQSPTTSLAPTTFLFTSTIPPESTISSDQEPEYIEDSCVVLLSFGMWQEKSCYEVLPFICYDEIFYGDVDISNETQSSAFLNWSEAGLNISRYRVEINGNITENITNGTSYQITNLDPGELYKVQIIPVRCERDLNAQNISFYTLPEDIRNLSKVSVETTVITLSWAESRGFNVSYIINISPNVSKTNCQLDKQKQCRITNLEPGHLYTFTVKAVVNGTICGLPDSINACTKPSKVTNLMSSDNASDCITANWRSPDINHSEYSYNITLNNETYSSEFESFSKCYLEPGTKYILNVTAFVPACSENGETDSITAYTLPASVSNLTLTSTESSINATWELKNGSFVWFNVTIFGNISNTVFCQTITTIEMSHNFTSLKSAALYTIRVVTYVNEDLPPSSPVNESGYTRPQQPRNSWVEIINTNTVHLHWEIPENSQGVQNIKYEVKYKSKFWNHEGNHTIIDKTSVIITDLHSGTNYIYSIIVRGENINSAPSVCSGTTWSINRTLFISLMCSSSTELYCSTGISYPNVTKVMEEAIFNKFNNSIFWNLRVKNLT